MSITKKGSKRATSEPLKEKSFDPYVVPETALRDLVQNLRVGQAQEAGMCLLVIGEAVNAIVKDKRDRGGLNLRVIEQIAGGKKCRPIKPIVEGINAAVGQGAEGMNATCLTITRFLEFAFGYAPEPRVAERLYKNELSTIKKRRQARVN